jgi:DNA polymerase III epsilon subunit family exonuclease
MSEFCNICLSKGRLIKFTSDRIKVCQWCVTLLQDTPINPEGIEQYLIDIVKKHSRTPPQKPEENEIREKAYSHVTNQESFFESITSIINKEKREKKVQELFKSMHKRAYASYYEEIKKYESEIDNEINDNYKKLLSGEYMPRELTSFFAKRDIFASSWSSPIRSAYKDSLDSTDKTYLKYMRAYNHHLLSGTDKSIRPDDQSMTELRFHIKSQDKFICKICDKSGKGIELHVHHIIPLDKFGSNHPNNLITLCYSCHNKQHEFEVTRRKIIKRTKKIESKIYPLDFIAVDIETTGLNPRHNEIIEISAIKFVNGEHKECFSSLINPLTSIPSKITELTGITDDMLRNAPRIEHVIYAFIDFIKCHPIVAHNAKFDISFISRKCTIMNEIFDSLILAKKAFKNLENYKLETLARQINLNVTPQHRAYEDALSAGKIYVESVRRLIVKDKPAAIPKYSGMLLRKQSPFSTNQEESQPLTSKERYKYHDTNASSISQPRSTTKTKISPHHTKIVRQVSNGKTEDNQKTSDVDYKVKLRALRAAGLEGYTDHLSQADRAVRWEKYRAILEGLDKEIEKKEKEKRETKERLIPRK